MVLRFTSNQNSPTFYESAPDISLISYLNSGTSGRVNGDYWNYLSFDKLHLAVATGVTGTGARGTKPMLTINLHHLVTVVNVEWA